LNEYTLGKPHVFGKIFFSIGILSLYVLGILTNPAAAQSKAETQDIIYAAKFICGSITGGDGPIRPGHYDTSISILNKRDYPTSLLWYATINDGPTSNTIIKNLEPEKSTGIICSDIKDIFGIDTKGVVEGYTIIRVPLSSLRGFDNEQMVVESTENLDILDVQVFYTANALETLPREVIKEKISFYIIQDNTGKIPKESFRKLLDITIPSTSSEISDTEQKIKSILANRYDLDKKELEKIKLRIKDISIGVGAMIDDHAISLHVVKPQISH
jgi:hypothetical protein